MIFESLEIHCLDEYNYLYEFWLVSPICPKNDTHFWSEM